MIEMRNIYKTLASLAVTALIFFVILSNIDTAQLGSLFLNINLPIFILSMLLLVPAIFLNSYRWKLIIKQSCFITTKKALRLTLMGLTFSSVTPSRIGDLTKAHYLKKEGLLNLKKGVSSVFLEKALDFLTLCFLSLMGLYILGLTPITTPIAILLLVFITLAFLLYLAVFRGGSVLKRLLGFLMRRERIGNMIKDSYSLLNEVRANKTNLTKIILISITIWIIYLLQFYLFFLAFSYLPPIETILALVPIAILVGMIPITVAGMGTRESALIILFTNYIAAIPVPLVLGVGLLSSLRYWISALFGLPFAKDYVGKL